MSPERSSLIALARFEFSRGIARPGNRMGFTLFVCALALGAYLYFFESGDPAGLFAEGFLIWMMGLVAFGLAADRRQAFDAYMVRNHVSAGVYVAAKALAMVGLILLAGAVAFLLRTAVTAGDVTGSLWSAAMLTIVALMVAPLAMIVEGQADTSMPAAFVIFAYVITGGLIYLLRHSTFVFELTGIAQLSPGSWESMGPLATRAAIGVVPGFLIAGALVRLNLRRY